MPKDSVENGANILHPVETQRASEAIYEQIKSLILSGQFPPGDRLPSERALMEILQRSRSTIREALRMLERAGFIRIVPGTHGAIVQAPGIDSVVQPPETLLQTNQISLKDLVSYRRQNDTAVARLAAKKRTEEDLSALEAALDQAEALMNAGAYESFVHKDTVFHALLAEACKNKVSYIISCVLGEMVKPMIADSVHKQSEQENLEMCRLILSMHRSILQAVRQGDEAAAEAEMARHIETFYTTRSRWDS